ncbi:MAG: hypothetical protein DWQ34_01435 [Planctomycetota bacterium]|nr:MAG: hypothetical protein DWQ29_03415 [Planctomycetota bacterium]REJ97735.1 MAG: hypothetical protein DWQ34_01435 [Planctomycetota bacterium]REK26651.1 MAG: hypothetical protein DWQ41_08845 [Planctomycetota bacterium]REK35690.1 MAG: hypothetical protein DWQ45_11110 [Planctomycetota bacterium]
MTSYERCWILAALLLLVTAGWLWSDTRALSAAFPAEDDGAAEPVESDMHEFMEYVFQPTFKRLKPAMAEEPVDNQAWKAIKADALILAEGGNLLLMRQPEEDAADWTEHSVQVRQYGGELYRAAKAKDYAKARGHYESMVKNCNACHEQFAGGEHILAP